MAAPGARANSMRAARRRLEAAGTGVSVHREDGTASASLALHARLAHRAGICRDARLTGDYTLVQRDPLSRPIDVAVTSYTRVQSLEPLSTACARRDTRLPPIATRARMQLAQTLRSAHPDDVELCAGGTRHVHATALLLHADAAEARRRFRRRISVRYEARLLRSLRLGVRRPDARRRHSGACRHRLSGRHLQSLTRTIGSCGRAMHTPGTKSGSRDAAGCASIPPRRSRPNASSGYADDAVIADEPLVGRWQRRFRWFADTRLRLDALQAALARAHPVLRSGLAAAACWNGCIFPSRTAKSS